MYRLFARQKIWSLLHTKPIFGTELRFASLLFATICWKKSDIYRTDLLTLRSCKKEKNVVILGYDLIPVWSIDIFF